MGLSVSLSLWWVHPAYTLVNSFLLDPRYPTTCVVMAILCDDVMMRSLMHMTHTHTHTQDLETLKDENKRLKSTRSEMDDELHTLTENLFEEAYKMVDEAKGNKVVAEKRLADAAGKIEAMETEMFALKSLLHNPEGVDSSINDTSLDKLHPSSSPHKHHHKRHSVKKVKYITV